MKVTSRSKSTRTRMYFYIKQDESPAVALGIVSLLEATKQAHKLAKSYLYAHLTERETKVEVRTKTAIITTIEAWRNNGSISVIHS